MIEIKNLCFNYEQTPFFINQDFALKESGLNVIVGPNGSGKTTLLKLLAGIYHPQTVEGLYYTGKNIFYLPQKISYPGGLNTKDYISSIFYRDAALKWFLSKNEKEQLDKILEETDLKSKESLSVDKLSAGELQKTNIAMGLLSGAEIFFLDEPTSNMDLNNQIKTMDMLKKLTIENNATCIVILHDLNLASLYGDYYIGINSNHEIISAEKSTFFKKEIMTNIFNIDFEIIKREDKLYVQIGN